jgi:hypothetical protein
MLTGGRFEGSLTLQPEIVIFLRLRSPSDL